MLLHVKPPRLLQIQDCIRQNTEVLSFTTQQGLHPKGRESATNHGSGPVPGRTGGREDGCSDLFGRQSDTIQADKSHPREIDFRHTPRTSAGRSGHFYRGRRSGRSLPAEQRTFPGAAAAASLGGDELPAQLGQAGLQQPQVVSRGLVLLRPGHLQEHGTEDSPPGEGSAGPHLPSAPARRLTTPTAPPRPCHPLMKRPPPDPGSPPAARSSASCPARPRPGRRPTRYLSLDLRDLGQRAAHRGDRSRPRSRPSASAAAPLRRPGPAARRRAAASRGSEANSREKRRARASAAGGKEPGGAAAPPGAAALAPPQGSGQRCEGKGAAGCAGGKSEGGRE